MFTTEELILLSPSNAPLHTDVNAATKLINDAIDNCQPDIHYRAAFIDYIWQYVARMSLEDAWAVYRHVARNSPRSAVRSPRFCAWCKTHVPAVKAAYHHKDSRLYKIIYSDHPNPKESIHEPGSRGQD